MPGRAANSYLMASSSGKVKEGSEFFLMHSTLTKYCGGG
jgi:hypothetical protein